MMEWEQKQQQQQRRRREEEEEAMNGNNGMFVKVMTDDQMETLRKQIAAYATICEQLVEMHKSLTSHPSDLLGGGGGGARLGNLYSDPLTTSAGHRITGRQRWTPTPMQLQILERIFEQGNGTPSKQKIKDITSELSQHGQISETNVYNWFQNRRARSKRKQQLPNNNNNNNAESEVETEVESSSSPNDKRTKAGDNFQLHNPHGNHEDGNNNNVYLHNIEPMHSSLDHSNESIRADVMMMMMKPPSNNDGSSAAAAAAKLSMSYYDTMLSNPRMDQLMGKMELSGGDGYNPYLQTDDYNMTS